ncbi:MAG: hypothetical protein PVJ76_20480 [Gemmatimonadota bacterium]
MFRQQKGRDGESDRTDQAGGTEEHEALSQVNRTGTGGDPTF